MTIGANGADEKELQQPMRFGLTFIARWATIFGSQKSNTINGGEEFHRPCFREWLDTEGASGPAREPAGESLRSKDPTRFHLWKIERITAPNADGANLESISG
jgi:hypothetical protein